MLLLQHPNMIRPPCGLLSFQQRYNILDIHWHHESRERALTIHDET